MINWWIVIGMVTMSQLTLFGCRASMRERQGFNAFGIGLSIVIFWPLVLVLHLLGAIWEGEL